jgi:hypothetical protein
VALAKPSAGTAAAAAAAAAQLQVFDDSKYGSAVLQLQHCRLCFMMS